MGCLNGKLNHCCHPAGCGCWPGLHPGGLLELQSAHLQPEGVCLLLQAVPVGLVCTARSLVVGCLNSSLHSYSLKGKRTYSVTLPSPILSMQLLQLQRQRLVKCTLVGLTNGESWPWGWLTYTPTGLWFTAATGGAGSR